VEDHPLRVDDNDISKKTSLDQTLASFEMIFGYAVIVVPRGALTFEGVPTKNTRFPAVVALSATKRATVLLPPSLNIVGLIFDFSLYLSHLNPYNVPVTAPNNR